MHKHVSWLKIMKILWYLQKSMQAAGNGNLIINFAWPNVTFSYPFHLVGVEINSTNVHHRDKSKIHNTRMLKITNKLLHSPALTGLPCIHKSETTVYDIPAVGHTNSIYNWCVRMIHLLYVPQYFQR